MHDKTRNDWSNEATYIIASWIDKDYQFNDFLASGINCGYGIMQNKYSNRNLT